MLRNPASVYLGQDGAGGPSVVQAWSPQPGVVLKCLQTWSGLWVLVQTTQEEIFAVSKENIHAFIQMSSVCACFSVDVYYYDLPEESLLLR